MAETMNKEWFLYLLRCADGSLYTGITNDLARRCKQHNTGTASRYTRSRLPVKLVYQELQAGRSEALKTRVGRQSYVARGKRVADPIEMMKG